MTLSWPMRAPGQPPSVAQIRPISCLSTMPATTGSDFHPLQIWRVRSSASRPARQFHSSGSRPVANSPRNSGSKRERASSDFLGRQELLDDDEPVLVPFLDCACVNTIIDCEVPRFRSIQNIEDALRSQETVVSSRNASQRKGPQLHRRRQAPARRRSRMRCSMICSRGGSTGAFFCGTPRDWVLVCRCCAFCAPAWESNLPRAAPRPMGRPAASSRPRSRCPTARSTPSGSTTAGAISSYFRSPNFSASPNPT